MNPHHPLAAALICAAVSLLAALPAHATQSPPPQQYTLTVNRSGGGDCTKVRIYSPELTAWTTTSVTRTFTVGTTIEVEHALDCPCGYYFTHWQSNDDQLDGHPLFPFQAEFQINQNTTATATFVPRTDSKLTVYVVDPTPSDAYAHLPGAFYVGHSFWLLEGNSCIADELKPYLDKAWGFHPHSDYPLFASLFPTVTYNEVPGLLQDDTSYIEEATDSRTYDITWNQLVAALQYTRNLHLSPPNYHLTQRNCTDKLFDTATAAGVTLPSAAGTCPDTGEDACNPQHFSGKCPGALGETLNP